MSSERKDNPLVTIIVASYNHSGYINECIYSVLNQTYKSIQLIVIDDASTDNSADVIKKIKEESQFIFIQNEKNCGLNNSIIKALAVAAGELISLVASDDYLHKDKIEKQLNYLQKNNYDGVYSTGFVVTEGEINKIELKNFAKAFNEKRALQFLYCQDFDAPLLQSGLFKTSVFKDTIPVRLQFKSDDWAFAIKVFQDFNIGFLDEAFFYYRIHETNTHKKYWVTFPMRIDVVSRLVPEEYRNRSLSNIFLSQGSFLLNDNKWTAIRFFFSSLLLHFSFKSIISIGKSVAFKLFKRKTK